MLNYHKQNQLWICFKTLQVRNNFERIYERFLISKSKSARRGNWQCQNYCTQLSSIRWIQPLLKNWQCQNYCTQIFKFGEYGHCWKALPSTHHADAGFMDLGRYLRIISMSEICECVNPFTESYKFVNMRFKTLQMWKEALVSSSGDCQLAKHTTKYKTLLQI